MKADALKKRETEMPRQRAALRAVESKAKRPAIKVYTGREDVKDAIEAAAQLDRPGQSVSAFILRLFYQYQREHVPPPHE